MKSLLLFTLSILFSASLTAQRDIEWQKAYGGSLIEALKDIKPTPDGGYIVVGYANSKNGDVAGAHGSTEAWVIKTDAVGTIAWQKCLGGSLDDYGYRIVVTKDGGYLVLCGTPSGDGDVTASKGGPDIWLVKLTSTGAIAWQRTYGGTNGDYPTDMIETADGGYAFAGNTGSWNGDIANSKGSSDAWIVKLDVSGNIEWEQTYGGPGSDGAQSVKQTVDGGYVVSGHTRSVSGDFGSGYGQDDVFLLKISPTGSIQWQKRYGGSSGEFASTVLETPDGYIMCGNTESNDTDVVGNHGASDLWVVKTNATGEIEWLKTYGGSDDDFGNDIQEKSGRYLVVGYTSSQDGDVVDGHGYADMWALELNADGSIHWNRPVGGSFSDIGNRGVITSDGGFIAGGYTSSSDMDATGSGVHGSADFWLVKFGPPVSVDEVAVENAISIYPTVTSNTVQVSTKGDYKNATVHVYNTSGQLLQTVGLTDGKASVDLNGYSAGVYLIQIANGNDATTYRILLQP
ncbi:MAG: hypothetical protein K0R82_1362 [Flavipsychrobacter sp.]|nr:hypothetical protein [Flavipsychrobacter sp.]